MSELRCSTTPWDSKGKGTFEIAEVSKLGSTIQSYSSLAVPGYVDVDPSIDLRISPIAAACSACHDSSEVRSHMISKGASFGATQAALEGKERCASCHGPGKSEDVRRAHEIGGVSVDH